MATAFGLAMTQMVGGLYASSPPLLRPSPVPRHCERSAAIQWGDSVCTSVRSAQRYLRIVPCALDLAGLQQGIMRTVCCERRLFGTFFILTFPGRRNYSAPMIDEFNTLDAKIARIVRLCDGLREENRHLQAQLVALERDKQQLQARMNDACLRLESLVTQLPESPEGTTP